MGRRLSDYERSQREDEKRRLQAERRAHSEAVRNRTREATDRRKAEEKAAKDAQTEDEIQQNKNTQQVYDNYISGLTSFHKNYNASGFDSAYTKRLKKRDYKENPLPSIQEFSAEKFSWEDHKIIKYVKPKFTFDSEVRSYAFNTNIKNWIRFGIPFILVLVIGYLLDLADTGMTVLGVILFGGFNGGYYYYTKNLFKVNEGERERLEKEHDDKHAKLAKEHDSSEKQLNADDIKNKAAAKAKHEAEHERSRKEYKENKANHKQKHANKEKANKEKFDENDVNRIQILTKAKDIDIESIEMIAESIFPIEHNLVPPNNLLEDTTIDGTAVGYNVVDEKTIEIKFELPDFDILIPKHKYTINPTGKSIKLSDISEKATHDLKNNIVCSLAFEHALEILRAYPFFQNIVFEAGYVGIDPATGKSKEIIILQTAFSKKSLIEDILWDRIDNPGAAMTNFDSKFSKYGSAPKDITSEIDEDKIVWSTTNADDDIPYGVNPKETGNQLP